MPPLLQDAHRLCCNTLSPFARNSSRSCRRIVGSFSRKATVSPPTTSALPCKSGSFAIRKPKSAQRTAAVAQMLDYLKVSHEVVEQRRRIGCVADFGGHYERDPSAQGPRRLRRCNEPLLHGKADVVGGRSLPRKGANNPPTAPGRISREWRQRGLLESFARGYVRPTARPRQKRGALHVHQFTSRRGDWNRRLGPSC
jgi:hypothetical protein